MSDNTGMLEPLSASNGAPAGALSPEVECRVDPTLVEFVAGAQRGWCRFRDAQLYVLAAAILLLRFAGAHKKEFRDYCRYVFRDIASPGTVIDPARASLETLVFMLQVLKDPAARRLKRDQRSEYANGLGWFAHLCPESDPDKAVELARSLGGLAGIAALYRKHKDEKDPSRQRRAAKSRATRSAQPTGDDESATPPASSAASPVGNERASPPEMAASAKDDTLRAPPPAARPGTMAASPTGVKKVAADELKAKTTTEKVEIPLAAVEAATYARMAFDEPQFAQVLVDHLQKQGIRPLMNLPLSPANQKLQVWLQANGTYFGPVGDASVCAMIAEQVVAKHLQQWWGRDPWRL
jgi:hypothetical protein